jgi:hypothetical protein
MRLSSLLKTIDQPYMKPIIIYNNNQSYISLSNNPTFIAYEKHMRFIIIWCEIKMKIILTN